MELTTAIMATIKTAKSIQRKARELGIPKMSIEKAEEFLSLELETEDLVKALEAYRKEISSDSALVAIRDCQSALSIRDSGAMTPQKTAQLVANFVEHSGYELESQFSLSELLEFAEQFFNFRKTNISDNVENAALKIQEMIHDVDQYEAAKIAELEDAVIAAMSKRTKDHQIKAAQNRQMFDEFLEKMEAKHQANLARWKKLT